MSDKTFGDTNILIYAQDADLKPGATRILSEDLSASQMISGIRIENPFARLH